MKNLLFITAILCLAVNAKVVFVGNEADVAADLPLGGPITFLGGGGTYDVDRAFQDAIDKVRGCTGPDCTTKVDVLVIRAKNWDTYNSYLYKFNGVDSVQMLPLQNERDVTTEAINTIRAAEVIFFGGGNQCDYITAYANTPLPAAIQYAHKRGAAIGGTSAGTAIMGEYTFDACHNTAKSSVVLADPYDRTMSFTYDFFNMTYLKNTLAEQHFVAQDRLGRLLVFLARMIQDGKGEFAWGVAVDEDTFVNIAPNGIATTIGNDGVTGVDPIPPATPNPMAYYILADHPAAVCAPKTPLTYIGYKVWKRGQDQTFDLANRPTTNPDYTIDVIAGVLRANGNEGSIY